MHYYVSNIDKKLKILFYIVVVSLLLNTLLKNFFENIIPNISFTITPFAIFTVLYIVYDKYLWKLPYLSDLPDLNGKWKGELTSSFDNFDNRIDIDVSINQTSSKILVRLQTVNSSSESVNLSMNNKETGQYEIIYNYQNMPTPDSPDTMHIHRGTVWLLFNKEDDKEIMEGRYFTDRERQGNYGSITLKKDNPTTTLTG